MKLYLIFICAVLSPFIIEAQNNQEKDSLDRANLKGLVIIGLTNNRSIETQFKQSVKSSNEFQEITISDNVLKPIDVNVLGETESEFLSEEDINILLNNNKIGQQILSFWFGRKANGTFDLNIIQEQHLLDTQEIAFLTGNSINRDLPEDIGVQQIVNSTYIILIDFRNIRTMESYYNENQTEDEYRILKGYISNFNYYLVKLDFNESVAFRFFRNYWLTEDTEQNLNKKEAFVATDFPFILIQPKSDQVASTRHVMNEEGSNMDAKLKEELMGQLVELVSNKTILNIEKENTLYKFNRIQGINPISASIGLKENLKFDQRYSIFINKINETGKVEQKKVAVVKAMKTIDNGKGAYGENNLSEFYQIGGKKITTSGMYLKEKKDLGVNIAFDRSLVGPINTSGRIEYYFSKLLDGTIPPGKKAKGMTSVKIYFEGGYNDGTYSIEERNRKFEFVRGSIGISKDFYPVRYLHWSPFVGYGIESATWKGSDNAISTNYVDAGLRIGINIIHNIQLIATVKNNIIVNSVLLDAEREVINDNFDYGQTFSNREGTSLGLGIRIML